MVTEYGKNRSKIIPIKPTLEERMHSLVMAGQVEWNGQKIPTYQTYIKPKGEKLLSDLVIENRK